jgi:hypothetical protein
MPSPPAGNVSRRWSASSEGTRGKDLTHAELEDQLTSQGRELLRQLYQDHLDLRSEHEVRLGAVTDAAGVARGSVESGHGRTLTTIFGTVTFTRLAYRRRGQANLHLG